MTREEIEKAQVIKLSYFETPMERIWYNIGCKDGLKAADAEPINVWHDASEEPQDKNKRILSYSEYFDYFFTDFPNNLMLKDGGQNKDWETVVLRNKMSKWLYTEDLLPKGGKR